LIEFFDVEDLKLFFVLGCFRFPSLFQFLLVMASALDLGFTADEVTHLDIKSGLFLAFRTFNLFDAQHQKQVVPQNFLILPVLKRIFALLGPFHESR